MMDIEYYNIFKEKMLISLEDKLLFKQQLENKLSPSPTGPKKILHQFYLRNRLYPQNKNKLEQLIEYTIPVYDPYNMHYYYVHMDDIHTYVEYLFNDYLPFQSISMANIVEKGILRPRVKYIHKKDYVTYLQNKKEYLTFMDSIYRNNIRFDVPSEIDLFDMTNRYEYNFKFLNQIYPEVRPYQKYIPYVIQRMLDKNIRTAFIPAVDEIDLSSISLFTGMSGISDISEMLSNNIWILNSDKLLNLLKKESGELVFKFMYYLYTYDCVIEKYNIRIENILQLLKNNSQQNRMVLYKLKFVLVRIYDILRLDNLINRSEWLDHINLFQKDNINILISILSKYKGNIYDVSHMIDEDYDTRWAPNKKQIAQYLWIRDETIRWINEISTYRENATLDELYNYYSKIESLNSKDILRINAARMKELNIRLHLNDLISPYVIPITENQINQIFDNCANNIYFSPQDIMKFASTDDTQCNLIIDTVQNPEIKLKMEKLLENVDKDHSMGFESLSYTKRHSDAMEKNPINKIFKLYPEYMPEWLSALDRGDVQELMANRQTILADFFSTWALRLCSLFVSGDPFVTKILLIPNVSWTLNLNRSLLPCILNRNMIFPLRISNEDLFNEGITMYQTFRNINTENKIFLGTLLINITTARSNKKPIFYTIYVFYKTANKEVVGYDFRGNMIAPGFLVQNVKVLYTELNTIKYAKDYLGYDLYFYRIDNSPNLLVSKYSGVKMDNLIPYQIIKDDNTKIFRAIPNNSELQMGGNDNCTQFPYDKFMNTILDFKLADNDKIFDDIVPDNIYQIKSLIVSKKPDQYPGIITDQFTFYLSKHRRNSIINYMQTLLDDNNIPLSIKKDIEIFLKKIKKIIFKNTFDTYVSLCFYVYIKTKKLQVNEGVVFSYNTSILETFADYINYDLNKKPHIKYFRPKYLGDDQRPRMIENQTVLNRYNISIEQLEHLSLDKIKQIIDSFDKKTTFIIIDANILVGHRGDSYIYRLTYAFQLIFSLLYISLNILDVRGTIHIVMPPMGKYFIIDMMNAILTMFESFNIYDIPDICYNDAVLLNNYAMEGFLGTDTKVMSNLEQLISIYQQIDPIYGYNFSTFSHIFPTSITKNNNNNDIYAKYREWLAVKINNNIKSLMEHENTIKNITTAEFLAKAKLAYINLPQTARKLDLEIGQWFSREDKYFTDILRLLGESQIGGIIKEVPGPTNKTHEDISQKKRNMIYLSENVYQYVEKIPRKKYVKAELFFNNLYKKMNHMLASEYDITIGKSYVSRAWVKMYEILNLTDFFSNQKNNTITGFHICEAPGNFISSITFYLNKKHKKYDWFAQSLRTGLQDDYGMIRNNLSKWDYGVDGTGDITSYDNFVHYVKTYQNSDILIGDCGEKWSEHTLVFAAYQLMYALLIPNKGGNFVIKTFAGNTNEFFLRLLEVAARSFDTIYYYKSYINYWSHEIYICGKSFRGIDDATKNILYKIMRSDLNTNNNELIDLLDPISVEVFDPYYKYSMNIIHTASIYKKFFVFCADNPEYLQKNRAYINNMIMAKNKKWIKYFIESNS